MQSAAELLTAIDKVISDDLQNQRELTEIEKWEISSKAATLKSILVSELGVLPSFLVFRKESFDTNLLVEDGTKLFPASLLSKVPSAKQDALQIGKALAFEVSTACGFHVFRLMEIVIKSYWEFVSDGADHPTLKTIGNYAIELDKLSRKDPKIVESLRQMAKLHRNPLIHPEVILTVEEAVETLGIARSIIGMMLRVIPEADPTTTSASILGA